MRQFKIYADKGMLERAQQALGSIPKSFPKALARAVNRSLQAGRTEAVKASTKRYTLKARDVREASKIRRATAKKPEGSLNLSGSNLPLRAFAHSPKDENTTGANRKPIFVTRERGRREPYPKAFKWRGHIFERTGIRKKTAKNPKVHETIAKPTTLSVVAAVGTQAGLVRDRMLETLESRLDHEVQVFLEGKVK